MKKTKFAELAKELITLYKQNPTFHDEYPGSWILLTVCGKDYPTLGTILGEVFFLNEDGEATEEPIGMLNSHCAFEDFTILVLEKIFSMYGVLPKKGETGNINIEILDKLANLVEREKEVGESSVYDERDAMCLETR